MSDNDPITVPLIDLRTVEQYQQGHHAAATHLPVSDLVLRRHELPLAGTALQLTHDDSAILAQAAATLREWGYPVPATVLLTSAQQRQWQQQHQWQIGVESQQLWQASSSLVLALTTHLPVLVSDSAQSTKRALDLACGSGRDALYLASQGYKVLAIDHKADALERLQVSAAAWRLAIETRCLDLESSVVELPRQSFALISVARYLHRPLLPQLRQWLSPNGVLVYETFLRGAERFGGPRRPAFLLEPGELAECYRDWHILHDAVVTLPDGRPVQQFIAQCPVI